MLPFPTKINNHLPPCTGDKSAVKNPCSRASGDPAGDSVMSSVVLGQNLGKTPRL